MKISRQRPTTLFFGPRSNLFVSNEWLNVISKTYGIQFHFIVDEDENFFLPFCLIKDHFFTSIKSIPFSDYTVKSFSEEKLNTALQLLRSTYPKYYIETSVAQKTEPIIKGFFSNKFGILNQIIIGNWKKGAVHNQAYERNIRKALNYGLSVKIKADLNSLNSFYKLHEQLRIHKFHKLPQPLKFFTNLYQEFIISKRGFFLEAWYHDILIASWVILSFDKTLYYKFGASYLKFLYLRPNDLLLRTLLNYGNDNGYNIIDLGFSGSTKNYEGLIRFKSKEGGDKIPIYRIEYFPNNFPEQNLFEKNRYLSDLTQRAIDSNDIGFIRQTSNVNYYKFA